MHKLEIDDVTKQYGDVTAVDDLELDVKNGEFVSLIGPSGCGKSTTLEMIAGLTHPSKGKISIAGNNVTHKPPKDRNIAMVFQNIALFPHMTIRENIEFGLRLKDYDEEEINEKTKEAVDVLQLKGMLERKPEELSGGQRQRAAIGRAIVLDPELFLMDEPLANLDAKLRIRMRTELQRLHNNLNSTIVYVTHDQEEAMTMSDRIAIMNEGVLQQFAPPLECYNHPKNHFVAGFIGSPSMHFINGSIENRTFKDSNSPLAIEIGSQVSLSDGDQAILGIRPEDVYLADTNSKSATSKPISLKVDVIQPMGDRIFVHLLTNPDSENAFNVEDASSTGPGQILMSLGTENEVEPGQSVDIVFDQKKTHLFDFDSGDAIAHDIEPVTEESASRRDF